MSLGCSCGGEVLVPMDSLIMCISHAKTVSCHASRYQYHCLCCTACIHRMLLRLSRMGVNTLYMDSDTMLFDDPYK
jgi:hypothetical protein